MPLFWYLDAREMLGRLAAIESGMGSVRKIAEKQKEIAVMAQEDIDRLKRIVAENTSVTNSVVTLIQGLAQQIREASDDPEEIRNLADQLNADVRKLTEAVTANSQQQPEQQPEQQESLYTAQENTDGGEVQAEGSAEGGAVDTGEGEPESEDGERRSRRRR